MKTRGSSSCWLGLVLACGALAFTDASLAGRPAKPPTGPEYVMTRVGGLVSTAGTIGMTAVADINDAGQVVGVTKMPGYDASCSQPFLLDPRDSNGDGRPDVWFADAIHNADGTAGSDGQNDLIIGLGNLEGALAGRAMAVNESGMVVGLCEIPDSSTWPSRFEGFILVPKEAGRWYEDADGDGINDLLLHLGSLPGYQGWVVSGLDVNNRGQVIGHFGNWERGFLLTPEADASGALTWYRDAGDGVNALMVDLGGLIPQSINDHGDVSGRLGGRAVLRRPDGTVLDLGAPGSGQDATAINDRGQVAVNFNLSTDYNGWHAALLTPLDTDGDGAPDTWSRDQDGDGVNDLLVDLGVIDNLANTSVPTQGLAADGFVVGVCSKVIGTLTHTSGSQFKNVAFLWRAGVMQSLTELTGSSVEFDAAYGIDDAGRILCRGEDRQSNGPQVTYLLIPAAGS